MTDTIAATKLRRFGLSADSTNCLVEFDKEDGSVQRLSFPAGQLDEVVGLLLQVRHIHSERAKHAERSVLVAERVGVSFQPEAQSVILDFVIGGAPVAFAIAPSIALQLAEIFKDKLSSAVGQG